MANFGILLSLLFFNRIGWVQSTIAFSRTGRPSDGSLWNPPHPPQASAPSSTLRAFTSPLIAMIGSKLFVAVSTLLVASSSFISAEECSPEVSATFVAAITNSTYLNTCAKDATYNLTSVFDVLNLTDAQMLTFCSSDVCLEPIHELMGSLNCNITYEGTPRNLSSEVSKLHDKCHDVVDAAAAANGTHTKDSGNDSTPDSTTPPASGTSSLALTLGSVVSAAIVAAFLA